MCLSAGTTRSVLIIMKRPEGNYANIFRMVSISGTIIGAICLSIGNNIGYILGLFFVLAMFVALTIIAYISDCKKLAGLCAIAALAIIVLACYYMPKLF